MLKIDLSNLKNKNYTVERRIVHNGIQLLFTFPNGYGASVIDHDISYGLEIAVLDSDGKLIFDTPITDDVITYNTPESAAKIIEEISKL